MGCRKSISKREVNNHTGLPPETGNKQSNFAPEGTRKRSTNKIQSK